jgi:peptide/nickel transport system permease protein
MRIRVSRSTLRLAFGGGVIALLVFCAIFAEFLSPYPPLVQHRDFPLARPTGLRGTDLNGGAHPVRFLVDGEQYLFFGYFPCRTHLFAAQEPGRIFLLGTDALGRDVLSRLLYGARLSLTIAVVALLISIPLALFIGSAAGYYGGATDFLLMRLIELFLALPGIYLVIALRSILPLTLPPEMVFWAMVSVVALFGWAYLARIVRGKTLELREREFITSARASGAGDWRIFFRHLLPNLSGLVLVQAALAVPGYLLAEVTLSYLGLGVPEPLPSWGNMLSATPNIQTLATYWWNLTPLVAVFATSLSFHMLAEGLRLRFDARLDDSSILASHLP